MCIRDRSYEDAAGEPRTVTKDFTSNVEELVYDCLLYTSQPSFLCFCLYNVRDGENLTSFLS